MATIYYPSSSSLYTRTIAGGLSEAYINVAPDTIFILSGSSNFTSSLVPELVTTGSRWEITASMADNFDGANINTTKYTLTGSYVNFISASYTLLPSDNGMLLSVSNSVVTYMAVSSSLPYAFNCTFFQSGSGKVAFLSESSVTMRTRTSATGSAGQFAMMSMLRMPNGDFILTGDMT